MHEERDFISELTELANAEGPFTDIRLEQDAPIAVGMPTGWTELHDYFAPSVSDLERVLSALDSNWEE